MTAATMPNGRDEGPDATGRRGMPRSEREPNGQGNQHQQNERSGDVGGIHGDALEQQREDDRHVSHRDNHQHDHQADRERHVALRQISELEEKGRTARETDQQQSDPQWFIQAEHSGKPDRDNRRQHEIRQQGTRDEPAVSQRGKNLRHGQCQPDGKSARHDEHHDRRIRPANQQLGQWHGVSLRAL
jgi:hypothetical protein